MSVFADRLDLVRIELLLSVADKDIRAGWTRENKGLTEYH